MKKMRINRFTLAVLATVSLLTALVIPIAGRQSSSEDRGRQVHCEALLDLPNVTITRAVSKPATGSAPAHCYVQGTIDSRIRFHMQLPLPGNWNGRLLNIGDGGKDGVLNFADHRLAQGYAVANSNTGHDSGAEPRATFAHDDLDAMIDFGHRAVHLTANVSKAVVRVFYGRPGRAHLLRRLLDRRAPGTDGGAALSRRLRRHRRRRAGVRLPAAQHHARVDGAARLRGRPRGQPRLRQGRRRHAREPHEAGRSCSDAVLEKCDANDGIQRRRHRRSARAAASIRPSISGTRMCPAGTNGDDCFTPRQIQTLQDIYRGPHDSKGVRIYKGMDRGSE